MDGYGLGVSQDHVCDFEAFSPCNVEDGKAFGITTLVFCIHIY